MWNLLSDLLIPIGWPRSLLLREGLQWRQTETVPKIEGMRQLWQRTARQSERPSPRPSERQIVTLTTRRLIVKWTFGVMA
jgi:hypothetical protein